MSMADNLTIFMC